MKNRYAEPYCKFQVNRFIFIVPLFILNKRTNFIVNLI